MTMEQMVSLYKKTFMDSSLSVAISQLPLPVVLVAHRDKSSRSHAGISDLCCRDQATSCPHPAHVSHSLRSPSSGCSYLPPDPEEEAPQRPDHSHACP